MIIIKTKEFIYENRRYIARLYKLEGNNHVFGEILLKDNLRQKLNMKNIAREYLHRFNIKIPTSSNINTHTAVKKLIEILEENE